MRDSKRCSRRMGMAGTLAKLRSRCQTRMEGRSSPRTTFGMLLTFLILGGVVVWRPRRGQDVVMMLSGVTFIPATRTRRRRRNLGGENGR